MGKDFCRVTSANTETPLWRLQVDSRRRQLRLQAADTCAASWTFKVSLSVHPHSETASRISAKAHTKAANSLFQADSDSSHKSHTSERSVLVSLGYM